MHPADPASHTRQRPVGRVEGVGSRGLKGGERRKKKVTNVYIIICVVRKRALKKRSHFLPSQALNGVLTGSGYHAAHEEMVGSALPMRSCHRHLPGDSPMLVWLAMVATQRHLSQLTRGPPRRTRNLVCRAHVACAWW